MFTQSITATVQSIFNPQQPQIERVNQSSYTKQTPVYVLKKAPPLTSHPRWDYDVFIKDVSGMKIKRVEMTQDQHYADVLYFDGTTKSIDLPVNHDHINLLLDNNVEISIHNKNGPSLFSTADAVLFVIQIVMLLRFTTLSKNKEQQHEKTSTSTSIHPHSVTEKEAMRASGKIVANTFIDCGETCSSKGQLRKTMMLSLSSFIAQDLLTGIVGHNLIDMFYIAKICFSLLLNHEILEIKTPEQVSVLINYVIWTYRQLRVLLRQNIKYLKTIKVAILNNDEPLDEQQIEKLLSGISCPIDPAENKIKCGDDISSSKLP